MELTLRWGQSPGMRLDLRLPYCLSLPPPTTAEGAGQRSGIPRPSLNQVTWRTELGREPESRG